jgi:hypothetical protein
MSEPDRICTKCNRVFPFEHYEVRYGTVRRRQCRDCRNAASARWVAKHPDEAKATYSRYLSKPGNKFHQTRSSAKKRGIPFLLSKAEYTTLCQQRNCSFCGIELAESERSRKWSLDRVDSSGPYAVHNCVVLCFGCNSAKKDWNPSRLRALADWIEKTLQRLATTAS